MPATYTYMAPKDPVSCCRPVYVAKYLVDVSDVDKKADDFVDDQAYDGQQNRVQHQRS